MPPTLKKAAEKSYAVDSGHWRKPDVRGMLRAMQGQACAYCQSGMAGRAGCGTVDHFRPKSTYDWLAYRIENLFLTCHGCNSFFKNDQFPLTDGRRKARSDKSLTKEPRLLLDPVADPIDKLLAISYDDARYPFRSIVRNLDSLEHRRVSKTMEVLGLDDKADLEYRKARIAALSKVASQIRKQRDGKLNHPEQKDVRLSVCRWQPFGEMSQGLIRIRLSLDDANKLCPSANEECLWLIDDLVPILNPPATTKKAKKQQDEILWCLAALLKAPPSGVSDGVIRERLEALELLSEIEESSNQLEQ
jgi:uncharacterized protein (TIGR02646 family)